MLTKKHTLQILNKVKKPVLQTYSIKITGDELEDKLAPGVASEDNSFVIGIRECWGWGISGNIDKEPTWDPVVREQAVIYMDLQLEKTIHILSTGNDML